MSSNSLFAILLRSPWWISFALAAAMGVTASTLLPKDMATFGPFMGLPFVVTGCVALWRQLRAPRASRIAAIEAHLAGLNWKDFSALAEEAYRRGGYRVTRREGAADFVVEKEGRTTLVAAKRWKAAALGLEVLRDLDGAREAGRADGTEVIAAGAVTDNARRFAEARGITVVSGPALARLFGFVSTKA